jgi:hypothetical protein
MLQGVAVAQNADGRRGARLDGYQACLVGEETVAHLAELAEAFLQPVAHGLGKPKMQRTGNQSRGIAALGKVETEAVVHEVGHALGGCRLPHVALLPAVALQTFLILHKP